VLDIFRLRPFGLTAHAGISVSALFEHAAALRRVGVGRFGIGVGVGLVAPWPAGLDCLVPPGMAPVAVSVPIPALGIMSPSPAHHISRAD
jgi:hypothetical protein